MSTQLDQQQILQSSYDSTNNALRTVSNIVAVNGEQKISISSSEDSIVAVPQTGTYTDKSGTTTATTSVQVLAANTNRKSFFFQNISDTDMYLCITGAAATTTNSLLVKASGGYYETPTNFVPTNAITVYCTASSKNFVAGEG